MATMAKWGKKKWNVSSKQIKALENLAFSYAQVEDNNSTTTQTSTEKKSSKKTSKSQTKTVTKKVKAGSNRKIELFSLTFDMALHAGVGIDVRKEVTSWKSLVTKVNYFYINGKKLFPKKLQLRQVAVSNVKLNDLGQMLFATLSFTFKEYDSKTTSVKVKSSVKKSKTNNIKNGSYVKIIGKKYTNGKAIPAAVKKKNHKVSRISGSKVLLGSPKGINAWVYLKDISLVK